MASKRKKEEEEQNSDDDYEDYVPLKQRRKNSLPDKSVPGINSFYVNFTI